jgi:hypothetical protein
VLVLQLVRILPDVLTTRERITRLDMIESEESVVLVAHMIHTEVDRRAVGCRGEHHIDHYARDVDFIPAGQWFPLTWLFLVGVVVTGDSLCVPSLFFIEELGDSVLPPELDPRLFRKVIDHLTCESYACHGVQDGLVGDHVANSQHFSVQTGLDPVYVLPFPDTCCDHGRAKVDKHRSGQTTHELLDYV